VKRDTCLKGSAAAVVFEATAAECAVVVAVHAEVCTLHSQNKVSGAEYQVDGKMEVREVTQIGALDGSVMPACFTVIRNSCVEARGT
jgi:hypothetical protein